MSYRARQDIKLEFGFADTDEIISNNVIRDNLKLKFIEVNHDNEKFEEMVNFIEANSLNKVLVYLYSKKKCEELSAAYPGSDYYHAGMCVERKHEVMRKYKNGDIRVLFATTAFGMGINIEDIDAVIHYQIPESVEEYYQHVGRGARNTKLVPECKCLMLWSETNFDRKAGRIKKNILSIYDLIE